MVVVVVVSFKASMVSSGFLTRCLTGSAMWKMPAHTHLENALRYWIRTGPPIPIWKMPCATGLGQARPYPSGKCLALLD
jgi:hypothetical protein